MRHLLYISLLATLLLAACTGGPKHVDMQQRLHDLNLRNRSDSVLTAKDRDEAQNLASYFERHGTANEQMLSHYLLGRAYADLHEAPMALHCYQVAAAHADTAAADCDFAQLSRVYGQSAYIFYQQGLYHNMLDYSDLSIRNGWLGKDTLNALISYAHKALGYSQLQLRDSAILVYKDAIKQLKQYHYHAAAASYSAILAKLLMESNCTEGIDSLLQEYELSSGFFDSNGDIAKGHEIYYSVKGLYYLSIHQIDSAEHYFRKELRDGKDFNNQNAASYGLALLYRQKHMPDSADKYSAYSYAMNDSSYAQKATMEVEQAMAMYNYSRQQEISQKERDRANREKAKYIMALAIALLTFCILVIIVILYRAQKKKQEEIIIRYNDLQEQLKAAQSEKQEWSNHIREFRLLIDERQSGKFHEKEHQLIKMLKSKEETIANLQAQIAKHEQQLKMLADKGGNELDILSNTDIYQQLVTKSYTGMLLEEKEWEAIDNLLKDKLPYFYEFMQVKRKHISDNEYKVCVLTRLGFAAKASAAFIGIVPSYITKYRKALHTKFFDGNGDSKAFVLLLKAIR